MLFGLLTDVSPGQVFSLNLAMLLVAGGLGVVLMRYREINGRTTTRTLKPLETESLTEESDNEADLPLV